MNKYLYVCLILTFLSGCASGVQKFTEYGKCITLNVSNTAGDDSGSPADNKARQEESYLKDHLPDGYIGGTLWFKELNGESYYSNSDQSQWFKYTGTKWTPSGPPIPEKYK